MITGRGTNRWLGEEMSEVNEGYGEVRDAVPRGSISPRKANAGSGWTRDASESYSFVFDSPSSPKIADPGRQFVSSPSIETKCLE